MDMDAFKYSIEYEIAKIVRDIENGREVRLIEDYENNGRVDTDVVVYHKVDGKYLRHYEYFTNSNMLDRCQYCGEFFVGVHTCPYNEEYAYEEVSFLEMIWDICEFLRNEEGRVRVL